MRNEVHYNRAAQKRRWLGYFDLLGTKARIESENHFQVFQAYAQAIEAAKSRTADMPAVNYACFSDSFIIYSPTDSGSDFACIESVARWFVYKLTIDRIPVRGALACGDFYADEEHSLYFGPALIEAYEYGEAQDWLGFLLSPSVVFQLDRLGIPADRRLNYAKGKIPFKKGSGRRLTEELPTCILGRWVQLNGRNPCEDALAEMRENARDGRHVGKYTKTLEFIRKNRRLSRESSIIDGE